MRKNLVSLYPYRFAEEIFHIVAVKPNQKETSSLEGYQLSICDKNEGRNKREADKNKSGYSNNIVKISTWGEAILCMRRPWSEWSFGERIHKDKPDK